MQQGEAAQVEHAVGLDGAAFQDRNAAPEDVENLIADSLLPRRDVPGPGGLFSVTVVAREDLQAFQAEYVSFAKLVQASGTTHGEVGKRLRAAGVALALPKERPF